MGLSGGIKLPFCHYAGVTADVRVVIMASDFRRTTDMAASPRFYIYLLDEAGRTRAGDSFAARSYLEAADTAAILYEACSDAFAGYELWCGHHRLLRTLAPPAAASDEFQRLAAEHQEEVVALEESLKDASLEARTSRRLLQSTERFLTDRYARLIELAPDPASSTVNTSEDESEEARLTNLLRVSQARVVRQRAVAASLEAAGHLEAAATARAVLATFQKTLMLLRRQRTPHNS